MMENIWVQRIVQFFVSILVLFVLLFSGVRLLLTEGFVKLEYNMPYFPADTYGMTKAERLTYAPIALEYLLNDAGISFLGDLVFEDGSPLYNERELSHMYDVKVVVQTFIKVWYVSILLFLGVGIWAWFGGWWDRFRDMLSFAGLFTIAVLGVLLLLIFLQFDAVFTGFHALFFEGDSWLFYYSDTLIRLFPLRFWQDAFILVGVITFGGGAALWRWAPKKR